MASANELVANYETLRGQVLGSQLEGGSSSGWARLVRQGLAAWLQTVSLPTPAPLPAASANSVAMAGLQSEVANVLITMIWNHYQEKTT
jgi:hypothetical protein